MSNPLTAAIVSRRTLRDQLLTEYPSLAEDCETLCDCLAGIDEFEEQVAAVLREAIEREAYAKAIGEMIETLTKRKRRLEEGAGTLRLAAMQAMQEAGVPKLRFPDMSVSIGAGKPKIIVVDEALIPDEFCRIARTANKTEIAKAIAAGRDVPGVELGNSQSFLSIHRA